jgi:alpha-amylase
MNWDEIATNEATKAVLTHYQKLGKFRANHPSVGAGKHVMLSVSPYVFKRTFSKGDFQDNVVVGLELNSGEKQLTVGDVFADGTILNDAYSGTEVTVENGIATLNTPFEIVLLEEK